MTTTSYRMIGIALVILAFPGTDLVAEDAWRIDTIAGTGQSGFSGDGGPAIEAEIDNPFGVVRGPDNAIWFCEYGGHRVRRIDSSGMIETIVGNGKAGYTGDGGPAIEASLNRPHEIRFDAVGDLFIADMSNHAIRKVDMRTRLISTIAGTGRPGYSGDGEPAVGAQFNKPHSLQFDRDGNLFVCDIGNHVIRKINVTSGIITTFAGTGKPGKTTDGAAIVGTPLNGPRSIDFDQEGNLWLVTREGNQVFRLNRASGTIDHVAGTGQKGFQQTESPAKSAKLNGPKGIALDSEGNAWLADTESHCISMIDARTGTLRWIAGTGQSGDGPNGPARKCRLNRPHGVFIDRDGTILIGDSEAQRVRVIRRAAPGG